MGSSDPTGVESILDKRAELVKRALDHVDLVRRGEKHHSRLPLIDLSVRDVGDTGGEWYTIMGHAATTNSEYVLFESEEYGIRVRERISANAFDDVLAGSPDVHLNINHDMRYVMARTGVKGAGSLELSMDSVGLRTLARVSPNITFVRDLAEQMRLGIIDQMSFAFTIAEETRTSVDDGDMCDVLYEIQKVGNLYDVCVCAQGANPQTDSSLRSLSAALGRDALALGQDRRATMAGGQDNDHRDESSSGGVSTRVLIAQAQARARSARARYSTKDN